MAINAFPIATVPPAANLIANTPFGIITATDVQAALNQLAGAIPSPGPGTDPLFLIHGEQINVTDPAIDANVFNRYALNVTLSTNTVNTDPSFANTTAAQFQVFVNHGQNIYSSRTQAKETFIAISNGMTSIGAGQRFVQNNSVTGYGMGDIAIYGNQSVTFAGGPIVGDEGQGWQLNSQLQQQTFLSTTTIFAVPAKSTINTTVSMPGVDPVVQKSQFAQTITLASVPGTVNVGDWVVVDQELPTDGPNVESVKLTGVSAGTPGTITGVFRCNHNNGCTVTPALLLQLNSTNTLGQDRVLVNWSRPSYSTGNITSITGGGFTGTGTGWTVGMVGGYAMNIGAITLPADDYPSNPFSALNPLKSVYQIRALLSTTSMQIMTTSVAGDLSYRGFGPPPSGRGAAGSYPYKIVPCAKILRLAEGLVICETSTSTWTVGDSVEQVICPYPDVSGHLYDIHCWTPGGTYRNFMHVLNGGARKINAIFEFEGRGGVTVPGGDGTEWGAIIAASCRVDTIFDLSQCISALAGIALPSGQGGAITWGPRSLVTNTANSGFDLNLTDSSGGLGTLAFSGPSTPRNFDSFFPLMSWGGAIDMRYFGGAARPYIMFGRDLSGDAANYTRSRMGYDNGATPPNFIIETQKLGSGIDSDIVIRNSGVEQMRFIAGSNVQFSNPASFSANGSVATVLGSVGPAGAATTVQKWLTFKDSGGTTRYIPCF